VDPILFAGTAVGSVHGVAPSAILHPVKVCHSASVSLTRTGWGTGSVPNTCTGSIHTVRLKHCSRSENDSQRHLASATGYQHPRRGPGSPTWLMWLS